MSPKKPARPRATQVAATKAVVRWYLEQHFRRPSDPGVVEMFCEPSRVGSFSVERHALRAGEGRALFRLLVATAMFQRRQDVQILRILQGMGASDAAEISDATRLLALVDEGNCAHMRSTQSLAEACDLDKDPTTRMGCCNANPGVGCHLKRHTVLLKRYGHFGKVPTSIALMVRESGAQDLASLHRLVLERERDPLARAQALESELSRAWRVSQKIASMFLSMVTNPDLSRGLAPWSQGIDWSYYVVIDSNVDLFLASIGYKGTGTYDARRDFVRDLARGIDLTEFDSDLQSYNPRLVQQAMYLFMSIANRRAAEADCMHLAPIPCATCPSAVRRRCPARPALPASQ
ncbi:hypothetical protein ACN6A1_27085 [Myxococcus virescens]|uniref:hypothetical protein n=1 Tax=Myxococcus TaxID=32 RepID=UPI001146AEB1|nr:hypothetical protein [Myxococcus sp. AB056]